MSKMKVDLNLILGVLDEIIKDHRIIVWNPNTNETFEDIDSACLNGGYFQLNIKKVKKNEKKVLRNKR